MLMCLQYSVLQTKGLDGKTSRADIIICNKYFKYELMNMVGGCRQLSDMNDSFSAQVMSSYPA